MLHQPGLPVPPLAPGTSMRVGDWAEGGALGERGAVGHELFLSGERWVGVPV